MLVVVAVGLARRVLTNTRACLSRFIFTPVVAINSSPKADIVAKSRISNALRCFAFRLIFCGFHFLFPFCSVQQSAARPVAEAGRVRESCAGDESIPFFGQNVDMQLFFPDPTGRHGRPAGFAGGGGHWLGLQHSDDSASYGRSRYTAQRKLSAAENLLLVFPEPLTALVSAIRAVVVDVVVVTNYKPDLLAVDLYSYHFSVSSRLVGAIWTTSSGAIILRCGTSPNEAGLFNNRAAAGTVNEFTVMGFDVYLFGGPVHYLLHRQSASHFPVSYLPCWAGVLLYYSIIPPLSRG